ncbi:signal transduction histidine kinase [Paenibacillus castaneae]|uniref:sensor histidine kinase n=2 Tax=Paenibacillus castaneae TaxID=474957 RepID=UPI000C9C48BE|nr:HAMP domain-containing sensor histidine kinase [Paenibacillus castaneae]NIK76708.1 signal transduction histidine kinase [Paenibacillus castaneae]
MLFYFIALMLAAVIVLLNNPRHETNHWAAIFLASAAIGGLYELIYQSGYTTLAQTIQFINYTCTPYSVLIFSIVYAGASPLNIRKWRVLKLILLLPVAAMAAEACLTANLSLFFFLLLLWSAPYFLISCYLLIYSFWREPEVKLRRNRFITAIIIVPTLLGVLMFIYVAKAFSPDFEFFDYISIFIIYSLAVALVCTFIYGVLGVRVRIEHDPLESTMKAVSMGTTLLNHTIKNEISKISISTENLRRMFPESNEQTHQHMEIITNSSNHMLAMVTRIHSQMKNITLKEEPVQLDQLINQCMKQFEAIVSKQKIRIKASYSISPIILCDSVHLSEAIGNVLMNACEAMPGGGLIEIELHPHKRGIELLILDRGIGVPAEKQNQVFDPFYSSGKTGRNFGLGLSYVYNVMQKSGGKVALSSRAGGGTIVSFYWPKRKLL